MAREGGRLLVVAGEGPAGECLRALSVAPSPALEVIAAASVEEAVRAASRSSPDLILAQDCLADGLAATLLAGGDGVPPHPLAVVSEDPDGPAARRALESGALDCLSPRELAPTDLPRLVERLGRSWREVAARRRAEAELREHKGRLDRITRRMGLGFAVVSREYRTLWANDEVRRVFGEVVGKPCHEAYSRRAEVCPGCGVRTVFEEGADRAVQDHLGYDTAGRPVWSQRVAVPIRDAGGGVTAALELFVPLTERKLAEEGLRRRLDYQRMLADVAAAAVRADAPDRFQEECVRILARTIDVSRIYVFEQRDATDTMDNTVEWVAAGVGPQRDVLQGIPAASVPWWMGQMRADQVICCDDIEEIPGRTEKEILRAQGISSVLVVPLFVGHRYFGFLGFDECRQPRRWLPEEVEVLRTVARFLSVTLERRYAEAALRESEARCRRLSQEFHAVLDAIPDKITLQSPELEVLWVNRGAAAGVEREAAEVVGRKCYEVRHGTDRPCDPCPVRRCLGTGDPADLCLTGPDGRTWEMRALPLRDEAGGVVGAVEVGRDITERRRGDAERESLIRELRARNEALDQFTSTVSHDLKGPLTTIRGFAGLMEREALEGRAERAQGYARHIAAAAERMKLLLDDLLALSRVGRLTHAPQPVPLLEVALEAASSFAVQAAERGVEIEIDPDLPAVLGDRTRLREVLENLLGNALKFLGDESHPSIRVGWRAEAGRPVFYVRDNGVGIDPEHHERVFGLFEKLDSRSQGTGLGLAIVKRIVEVHGGRVWVESEGRGKGAAFCFFLGGGERTS